MHDKSCAGRRVSEGDIPLNAVDIESGNLILADSKAAIAAVKKAGKTGKARSRHLQRTVNMIAEVKKEEGEVKKGWVKAHMGILGNEAAKKRCGGGATG